MPGTSLFAQRWMLPNRVWTLAAHPSITNIRFPLFVFGAVRVLDGHKVARLVEPSCVDVPLERPKVELAAGSIHHVPEQFASDATALNVWSDVQ